MFTNLSTPLVILEFILAFGFLVFIHEFGHLVAALLVRVKVEEFGFGFPPRLAKLFEINGIEFTLNWIPFGAFVRPAGENDPNQPGGLAAASPWARLLVLSAGPIMNVLTGILLFALVFMQIGAPQTSIVQIYESAPDSPAQMVGLQSGDVIKSVNGTPITDLNTFSGLIQRNKGQEITIVYLRDGRETEVKVTPRSNPPEGQGALGVVMGNPVETINFAQALPVATQVSLDQAKTIFTAPVMLVMGRLTPEESRVVGPVSIFNFFQGAREQDVETTQAQGGTTPAVSTMALLATLSIALGMTNLLPLPALDGGRILFLLPELLFRRRVPAQFENMVHMIGFFLLLGLMVFVTFQDIFNPVVLP